MTEQASRWLLHRGPPRSPSPATRHRPPPFKRCVPATPISRSWDGAGEAGGREHGHRCHRSGGNGRHLPRRALRIRHAAACRGGQGADTGLPELGRAGRESRSRRAKATRQVEACLALILDGGADTLVLGCTHFLPDPPHRGGGPDQGSRSSTRRRRWPARCGESRRPLRARAG